MAAATRKRIVGLWFAASVLAALLRLVLDRVLAAVVDPMAPLMSTKGMLAALSLEWLGAAVVGSVLLGVGVLSWLKSARVARWSASTLLAVLVAYPLLVVGAEVTAGAWISKQSYAPVLEWLPVTAGLVAAIVFGGYFSEGGTGGRVFGYSRRQRWLVVGLLTVVSAVFAFIDLQLKVGLFPDFHLFCHATSLVAGLVAAHGFCVEMYQRGRVPALLQRPRFVLCLAVLVCTAAGTTITTMSVRTRAELVMRSGPLGTLLRRVAPRGPTTHLHRTLTRLDGAKERFDELLARDDPGTSRPPADRPWNVILMVVDTLRADVVQPARGEAHELFKPADTPFLDDFVARSFRFRRSYSQSTMTHRSMPAMFRSLEPNQNPDLYGDSLPRYAAGQLGLSPLAVVNNYFAEPRYRRNQRLLRQFDYVHVYEKLEMSGETDMKLAALRQVKDRPFFAWLHYYCMHDPGFDGTPLRRADGSWPERYVRSLRWLDGELKRLMDGVAEMGMADRTIVVLTSDHGEGLGANRIMHHGPTVFDEELRVPLVIHVPGLVGREVDATVGNIDILPTLTELLGKPVNALHQGRSLVGMMTGAKASWRRGYYLENGKATQVAVVVGKDKLVHDIGAQTTMRFDLDEDPTEDHNLFDETGALDRTLLRLLLYKNPKIFAEELKQPQTHDLLLQLLKESRDGHKPSEIEFLLQLVALKPSPSLLDWAAQRFTSTSDDDVRARLLHHLFRVEPTRFGELLQDVLEKRADGPQKWAFVRTLADRGQGPFARRYVAGRWRAATQAKDLKASAAWLRLIQKWPKKRAKDFNHGMKAMLVMLAGLEGPRLQNRDLWLSSMTTMLGLPRPSGGARRVVADAIYPLLSSTDLQLRAAAVRALGRIRATWVVDDIMKLGDDSEYLVRQAALHAVARLKGKSAASWVAQLGKDPLLVVDAISALKRLKNPESLPYLQDIADNFYNRLIRKRARKAIKVISEAEDRRRKREQKRRPAVKTVEKGTTPVKVENPKKVDEAEKAAGGQ